MAAAFMMAQIRRLLTVPKLLKQANCESAMPFQAWMRSLILREGRRCAVHRPAISGSGVALGRSVLVAGDLEAGRLVRPFGDAQAYDFAYYIVHEEEPLSPAVSAFKEWLLAEAGEA